MRKALDQKWLRWEVKKWLKWEVKKWLK